MLKIVVKNHALRRWPERLGREVDQEYVEQLFRNNNYGVIEPGKKGRLIIKIKDFVLVISKTNTSIIVHTVYGTYEEYEMKRPNAENAYTQFEIDKWERHMFRRTVRGGRGAL